MLNLLLVGSSGGIGTELIPLLEEEYNLIYINSRIVDITKHEEVEKFLEDKDIDIVLNLATFNYDVPIHKINNENLAAINKSIDVNVRGTVNLLSVLTPKMREKQFGRYITASSVLADKPVYGASIYSASKAFNESMMRTASLENAKFDITFNSVQLGYFDAGLFKKIRVDLRNSIIESIPMKRTGKIHEFYNAIKFIIETPYFNGNVIKINGGML